MYLMYFLSHHTISIHAVGPYARLLIRAALAHRIGGVIL